MSHFDSASFALGREEKKETLNKRGRNLFLQIANSSNKSLKGRLTVATLTCIYGEKIVLQKVTENKGKHDFDQDSGLAVANTAFSKTAFVLLQNCLAFVVTLASKRWQS